MTNYLQLTCERRYQISRWLVTLASIQTRYVLAGHVRSKHANEINPNDCDARCHVGVRDAHPNLPRSMRNPPAPKSRARTTHRSQIEQRVRLQYEHVPVFFAT